MEKKHVFIVMKGQWGEAQEADYDHYLEIIKDMFKHEDGVLVEMVKTTDAALERIKEMGVGTFSSTLVFRSRSNIVEAREIKKVHRFLRIVVLTGLIPDEEVRIVGKGWGPEAIKRAILYES